MWASTISVLPEVPVLTLDAPGFGRSAPLEGGLEEAADAVTGTLAAAGVTRAVVAGLSMGGYTLPALAERHPRLLTGVGLLDTKASIDPPQGRANRLQMAEEALGEQGAQVVAPMIDTLLGQTPHEEVRTQVSGWLSQAPPSAIAWAQRAMAARPDRLAALAHLDVPALVLRGAQDATASLADHQAMATELGTDVVEVDGAGHLSAVESPHQVAAALADLHR